MNEAILDKKIKTWEDQLLDLGKRNKMISFRESKRATLKILKPGFEELYQQIVVDEKELTFQKAIDRDSDVRVFSILSLLDKLSCPMEVNIGDIRAEGTLPEIKKTLKHLRSKARLSIDEQGTNILYLVFGFIEWREKGSHGDNWIKSPLILSPVTLSLPSLNAQYTLKKHEDEVVVNPTLAYLFERDYGISLPEFDSDKDTLDSFMQKMEELVDERGWRIVRECSMGLVSFLKISMYNDLIRNEAQLKANPIIRAFAGERNEINTLDGNTCQFDHDACRSVDSFQVLDADSSQQDAIALSQKGVSFVMQGPPGTGKSQTITNIIAQALADGKKILFVSEKMAALDVVYRRLTDVHLADFCLSLHSHKANKKEILTQLGENLGLQRMKVKDEEIAKLTRLDMLREQLKAYVRDIHQTVMPLEMSLYEVYGAILELGTLPDIDIHLANVDKLTKDDVNRLSLIVMNLDKAQGVLGSQWYKNPWQGITGSYLEVSQKRDLENKLYDAVKILSAFDEAGLADKTLGDILSVDTLDAFWELYGHALHCSVIPNSWFHRSTETEESLVRTISERKQTIDSLTQALSDGYDNEFLGLPAQELREKLISAMNDYCTSLRRGEGEEAVFTLVEKDLEQLSTLGESYHLLMDVINIMSCEYKLHLSAEYSHVAVVLSICEMLLEKRNLTDWYFNAEGSEVHVKYVTELQNKLDVCVHQKQRLCERYSDRILECQSIRTLLDELSAAQIELSAMVSDLSPDYPILCEIASFDTDKSEQIEAVLSRDVFAAMAETYGMPAPTTLAQVQIQISAIEKVKHNKVLPVWRSAADRNKTKQLLREAMGKANKLSGCKKELEAFFARFGFAVDVDTLSEDDTVRLQCADGDIPEASTVVASCHNDAAYRMLETVDINREEYLALEERIKALRAEYRIDTSLTLPKLSAALRDCRDAVAKSKPCSAWGNSKSEAQVLLKQLSAAANSLKEQRGQILQTCEESVFTLDCIGMLNRFKAEYTNFFRIFKSSYKEDMKLIRLAFKDVRKKISDEEIITLLQTLRKYNETLEEYNNFADRVSELLDVEKYDIGYDWNAIIERIEAFNTVSAFFRDDSAAYEFIVGDRLNVLNDVLTRYNELNSWFADNKEAREYYAGLYRGIDTDTAEIRSVFEKARAMSAMFVSPQRYVEYVRSDKDAQSVKAMKQNASDIVAVREWFDSRRDDIRRYTDVEYTEGFNGWQTILSQIELFESIVAITGEVAGYALVEKYSSDKDLIENYLDCLTHVTKLSEYAKAVYHRAVNTEEFDNIQIGQLIADIRKIVSEATRLQAVYTSLSAYCPEGYADLSLNEIKADLDAVLLYRDTRDRLYEIEEEARGRLGDEYVGVQTSWQTVHSNIAFCDKVSQYLSGEVSAELVAAFVNGSALYSEAQLSKLREYYALAKKAEAAYPVLTEYRDLEAKLGFLTDMITALSEVIRIKNIIRMTAYSELSYSEILESLKKSAQLQQVKKAFSDELKQARKLLPTFKLDGSTDWGYTLEIFNHLRQLKRLIGNGNFDPEIVLLVTNAIPEVSVVSYRDRIEKLMQNIQTVTDITDMFETKAVLHSYDLSKLTRRLRSCKEQFASMDAWIDFRDCKKVCEDNGLRDFIQATDYTYYVPGTLKDVFLKAFYYEWFEKVCTGIESVSTFRVRAQESRVEAFRELDSHSLPIDQMRIREKLIREMPSRHNFGRATDEMSLLLHELNKKRNIMPLRKLFRTIPNLLLRLKPCLMMSPLSVSYFLEAETYRFDMVIFDEASQIFPQDAIGAVFRAKQVIIAGDSKQLPPTNFFAASTSNDNDFDVDDEDEEEINFDSILEEASNSLINCSLLWHYRSRFEELIAFSNQQIYQNNLITFPSSTVQATDTGVEYVYVENGVYENRCNRAEAQEIVRLVAEHIRNYPDRSLGIIAFSESQQSVIEDEINKYRMQNPRNESFFNEDKEEPFFIKNLENVQGDERDTIIFSVCYGKNAQGRMYMRFGPLGHQGGERRLNVAITRAKHNIKLVGSILPEDIDLSKTHSEGVRMLRYYISFAMRGVEALPRSEKKNSLYEVDTFSEQVGNFLISRGCTVKMNVGSSDYTIDIAVEHPKKPGHYIAGIECDGSSYYMARTVRDREHLRTAVLEQMGWKMYRVWSTEWIRNPDAEKERLIDFIQDALLHNGEKIEDTRIDSSANETVETEVINTDSTDVTVDSSNPYDFPLYREGRHWDRKTNRGNDNLSVIADMVYAVVSVEQPMHMELLYKRVGKGFNTGKATQGVKETIDQAIRVRMKGEVVIEDQFIRLISMNGVQVRRSELGEPHRAIEHISIPEIAAAMEKILDGAYGMDRSVLCSEAAKVFGYERNGVKIKQRTNEAVDYLVINGKVSDYDDKILLLEV